MSEYAICTSKFIAGYNGPLGIQATSLIIETDLVEMVMVD